MQSRQSPSNMSYNRLLLHVLDVLDVVQPRLAETRRSAIHCGPDADVDYYRLRSFSITSHGVCNLGDSLR